MIKTTLPDSWQFNEPITRLVDVHSRGIDSDWMIKRAAASVFSHIDLRPDPNHSLIHLIAMGDADRYGPNRNADSFYKTATKLDLPRPDWQTVKCADGSVDKRSDETFTDRTHVGNVERAQTFVDYAKVFKSHKNKPYPHKDPNWKKEDGGTPRMMEPHKVYGTVKAAAHNDEMGRVELLIQVPHGVDWDDDLQKLANDGDLAWSMAAFVPWDACACCGHKAPKKDKYCEHLTKYASAMLDSGHTVSAVNDYMTYFDISRVPRPADRIAYGLLKAASYPLAAELSEMPEYAFEPPDLSLMSLGQTKKAAYRLSLLAKLADIEKRISLNPSSGASALTAALVAGRHTDKEERHKKLAAMRGPYGSTVDQALGALVDRGIILPFEDFMVLTAGLEKTNAAGDLIAKTAFQVPGMYSRVDHLSVANNNSYDPQSHPTALLSKLAGEFERALSVLPEHTGERALSVLMSVKPAVQEVGTEDLGTLVPEYATYKLAALDELCHRHPHLADYLIEAVAATNMG